MSAERNTFYITTPIYYVNDRPHIGHVYSTTVADIIARYHRLCGRDVFFLTGTDEHGKKVADSAREQGVSPQEFVDRIAGQFESTFRQMNITHSDFIRTTQPRHTSKVRQYVEQMQAKGDVYAGEYEGWYDEGQEEYVTETNAKASDFRSPVSGAPLVKVKEKNYFFALSRYQDRLIDYIEAHPQFIQPAARRNEVLSRLRDGIRDVAISRTTEPWGVPMPGDDAHSIYVWIDALFNYITTIDTAERAHYWPADVHLIGKEILWFHAVIWPAVLMSLERPIYRRLYAHSFWISEGQKMSKTLGNFVDLEKLNEYVETFGLDALRYYLATQGPMGASDADFAHTKFVETYNSDLANTLGNCVNRVVHMTNRYFEGSLPAAGEGSDSIREHVAACRAAAMKAVENVPAHLESLDLGGLCENGLSVVRAVDLCIDKTEPFRLAKDDAKRDDVGTIMVHCAEAVRVASLCLWPVLPEKTAQIWDRLGCGHYAEALDENGTGDFDTWARWGQLEAGTPVTKGDPLFPRHQQ